LKENILFGNKYDKNRYEKVLFACSLLTDIKLLANGDLTEIGERGINLSGGQQQRVNLARAAYSLSDIILLDDPLSAVDSLLSKHIFDELIVKFLSNRTRLLVTHNISYCLPASDIVICIDKITKKVAACCHPKDLSANLKLFASQRGNIIHRNGSDLLSLLSNEEEDDKDSNNKDIADISSMNLNDVLLSEIGYISDSSPRSQTSPRSSSASPRSTKEFIESKSPFNNIIIEETKSGGDIALEVYQFYINALGGLYTCLFILIGEIMISFLWVLQTYSLGKWMDDLSIVGTSHYSLYQYLSVNVILVICTLIVLCYQAILSIRASNKIHYNLLTSVLLAPISWFDSNPIGRICNRFSQDISDIDNRIMDSISGYIWCSLNTIQIVSIIAYYLPFLLIPFVPVICFTFWVSYSYLHVSRELKRLESLNKSPLFALFSETLTGLPVIRSFKQHERFFNICKERIDNMNRPHIYLWLCNRWLNFRMQMLGSIVAGAVGFAVVQQASTIGSIAAGLSLLYSLNFCDSLTFLARSHADVQMAMNSAERVKEYSNLNSEKYLYNNENINTTLVEIPSKIKRSSNWPKKTSSVEFKNLSLEYQINQPVLKNVSFKIPKGKKLGIVGRTGSGKSSLIVSLFRLFEPMEGSEILIDDKNILDIDLIQLRSSISIVPQDPTLFSGTIKTNLDPFNNHSEEQLWKSLQAVQLTAFVASMSGNKLNDKIITDKGSNLSVGQRQLLCLARAILRDSSVLVLDECTANVDHETDGLIQETVQKELSSTTVLCIAHRLQTIAYYDLILVMDAGEVKEYDSPLKLLQQDSSIFKEMCLASGDFDSILNAAMKATTNNNVTFM
jgi:ABC-type multidrug transport system fused ATPase/permease subunit